MNVSKLDIDAYRNYAVFWCLSESGKYQMVKRDKQVHCVPVQDGNAAFVLYCTEMHRIVSGMICAARTRTETARAQHYSSLLNLNPNSSVLNGPESLPFLQFRVIIVGNHSINKNA